MTRIPIDRPITVFHRGKIIESSDPQPISDESSKEDNSKQTVLSCSELLDKIINALETKTPLSIVSMGATEAFVMAQYSIYPEEEFMQHREAYNANLGERSGFFHRGIRFPNRRAHDDAVEAVRKADIVGYNTLIKEARELAEKVLEVHNLQPRYIFEANLRRVFMFSQRERFRKMLSGRKILLIGSLAKDAKTALEKELAGELGFEVVGAISIYENEEIPYVKEQLGRYDFDLCFLAAGVNALILAPYITEKYGKVAFDIGHGMMSFINGEVFLDGWITEEIGLENLYRM
jgi:hypothetical protein